jgi:hypothetical protein
MSTKVCLEYGRIDKTVLSTGRITSNDGGLVTEEGTFEEVEYRDMLKQLVTVLSHWPIEQELQVELRRTERPGLLPYALDQETVRLLRTDPVAGITAMQFAQSPSMALQRLQEARAPNPPPVIRVGHEVLADAFGGELYFKVRGHELECPGCGFWGPYTTPWLLANPDREGAAFKTVFLCNKRCRARFVVSCAGVWGQVQVAYLLNNTKLDAFYFPRAWNEGRPWVTRDTLKTRYETYLAEKEKVG